MLEVSPPRGASKLLSMDTAPFSAAEHLTASLPREPSATFPSRERGSLQVLLLGRGQVPLNGHLEKIEARTEERSVSA